MARKGPVLATSWAEFLRLVTLGETEYAASRAVEGPVDGHESLRRLRAFARSSPTDLRLYEEAVAAGGEERRGRLEDERLGRSLDAERPQSAASNGLLLVESEHADPDFRRTRAAMRAVSHSGTITHRLWDPDRLRSLLEAGEVTRAEVETWARVERLLIVGPDGSPVEVVDAGEPLALSAGGGG